MAVAVLAVQGAFMEHRCMLARLGVDSFEIRRLQDLRRPIDALILPGGESTVQGKLLCELGLFAPLQAQIKSGLPVFGTCAGLILLAKEIADESRCHLGTMDICAYRNAYGRQLGSFQTAASFGDMKDVPMRFIRAPYIGSVGEGVEVLAKIDGRIVAARQGTQLACAFHPELTDDTRIHRYFLRMAHII